jgi:tetratricopeptide (TPR) repeat protein
VTGAGSARTRLEAAARRGLTRFVGRDAELAQLRRAQQLAGNGHGQVAAIVGEAGVGKSRLVYEFTHSHRLQGWLVLESASVSYGKATSYFPVIDLLKGHFKIQDRDDVREIREKATGKLLTLDQSLGPALPALLALLDVAVDDASWQTLDPAQRRQRTLDAVKQLLLREAREQPLLVIFEDLHWIDGETQALLDSLVDSLGSARLLLLVNYRPEYQHSWSGKTYYSQMRLDALQEASAGELLDALLGDDPGLLPLKQLLVRRGNPFFLEETVRTLVETRALVGKRGRYRLTQPVQAIQIPPTVHAMLAARIDRLPQEDRRLLQVASVVGKDVPFALLHAIVDLSDEALRGGLSHLQAAEFLYETGLYPDLEYSFKHALTHDVTYGGLLQERRRELHARIVGAIETLHRDRLGEQVERLAHHAFRGEIWDKAVPYLRQAGTKAADRSAHREAVGYLEQALSALAHLSETRETLEQAIDLRIDLRNSLWQLAEFQRMFEYLCQAEDLAKVLDDPSRLGWVSEYLSQYFWLMGDSIQARAFGRSARAIAETLGDLRLRAAATTYLGAICFTSGDYRQAEDLLRQVVESLEGEFERERCGLAYFPVPISHSIWAWALAERGVFDRAVAHGQAAMRLTEALDHPYTSAVMPWTLGPLYTGKGEFAQAIKLLERGRPFARDWNFTAVLAILTGFLGHAYALSGRVAEGLALLEPAVKELGSLRAGAWNSLLVVNLAEAYTLAGQLEDARAFADQALTLTRERGQRGWQARALWILGEIASRPDVRDVETAPGHYRQAMRLAGELEMRPLVAHCHLGLGKLYRCTGKAREAQEHLATATTMYGEMDMQFWLAQAEAEMRALA